MLSLLELLLPEVAAHHRVAVLVYAIGEVLAGHARHASPPALQFSFLDVVPACTQFLNQCRCITAGIVVFAREKGLSVFWSAALLPYRIL